MPARKLSQADLDDLRDADNELLRSSNPRRVILDDGAGNRTVPAWDGPAEVATQDGIAAWKGITLSHFHALKRQGWTLKRGIPAEDRPEGRPVGLDADTARAYFDMMQERLFAQERRAASLQRRIDELEAMLEDERRKNQRDPCPCET